MPLMPNDWLGPSHTFTICGRATSRPSDDTSFPIGEQPRSQRNTNRSRIRPSNGDTTNTASRNAGMIGHS